MIHVPIFCFATVGCSFEIVGKHMTASEKPPYRQGDALEKSAPKLIRCNGSSRSGTMMRSV